MKEEALELPTTGGKLSGTLALPDRAAPWPLVMLIAGAGPTDRDGNSILLPEGPGYLRQLAYALAAAGIATLRYDKRGVGASVHPGLRESELRFRHLVDDAAALGTHLMDDARFGGLVLLGHSEGALIAALAARTAPARAVVYLAGAGRRASEVMRAQLQGHVPAELEQAALATLAALEAERIVPNAPDDLVLLFRPSVQPYLVSWFRYDPAEVLEDLALPLLIVHGTADTQLPPEHARHLHGARPDATLLLVKGMDHALAVGGDLQRGVQQVAAGVVQLLEQLQMQDA